MRSTINLEPITESEYLASEIESDRKREFVGGSVYFRPDEITTHHRIATNGLGSLGIQLRGKTASVWNTDTKVRIQLLNELRFYYPDAMVVCDPNPGEDSFQEKPRVILEVISENTRRIDEGEKKDAYLSIPSLDVYIIAEQKAAAARVYRRQRSGLFEREIYEGLNATIPLPEIEAELPLGELYENVEFS